MTVIMSSPIPTFISELEATYVYISTWGRPDPWRVLCPVT